MKRLSILAALVVSAVTAAAAQAHVFQANTKVSIGKSPSGVVDPGDRVVVHGQVNSARQACESGKLVQVLERRPGADRVLASDRTDGDGEYRVSIRPREDLVVYASFDGSTQRSYGHSHRCNGDDSRQLRINVRGR